MTAVAGSSAARDAAGAADSPFRRHWTWRDRALVGVAGWAIATVLRVVYATLRVRWFDPHGVLEAHAAGTRVVWATWHDGILLLPLMKVRVRPALRPRVADPRLAITPKRRTACAAISPSRCQLSTTRGWLGAVRGLLAAHARGEDLVVIPDGPRGPRHRAQEGVVQVARATHLPVVAIGIAASPVRRLRTWDRLMLPRPFGRIALVLSAPIPVERAQGPQALVAVESALEATADQATESLGASLP